MAILPIRHAAIVTAICGAVVSGARADSVPVPRFEATLQHPLFSPTRRPPPPELAPAPLASLPVPAALPPNIVLSGVIMGGGTGVALLRRPQDAVPIRVAPGGQVDGWTVAEIHPRAIVLRREDRSVTVDLPQPPR